MAWTCERCGRAHDADEPPCDACGHDVLEPADVPDPAAEQTGGGQPAREQTAADVSGPMLRWVCTECGRAHPRHSPPCSSCGNARLERREVDVDPAEVATTGYRELVTGWHLAVLAVALVAAAVLGLGALGVVNLPGATEAGAPDAPTAPGNASAYEGTSLATVESAYLETVNDERAEHGSTRLSRTDDLDAIATFHARWWVRSEYAGDELPMEEVEAHLARACSGRVLLVPFEVEREVFASAASPGETIAERIVAQREAVATASGTETGVDVHVGPDGRAYLTQVVC